MCLRNKNLSLGRDMNPNIFKKIINELPSSVESVNLASGLGEPLLHPLLFSFINQCKKRLFSRSLVV
jgi:hypothetical protein